VPSERNIVTVCHRNVSAAVSTLRGVQTLFVLPFLTPVCQFSSFPYVLFPPLPMFYIFFSCHSFWSYLYFNFTVFINFPFGFLFSFLSFCASTLLAYFVFLVSIPFLNYSVLFFIFILFPVFLP
jgi:hypothetical protein